MLFEKTFHTLKKLGNERLQLPIFYESPVALRFETGDPTLPVFLQKGQANPLYKRSALWRTSFLYEKVAPFDTLLWVLYRTSDVTTEIGELIERFCMLSRLSDPTEIYQQAVTTADGEPMTRVLLFWNLQESSFSSQPLLEAIVSSELDGFRELSSAVFFFDTQKHILFHPYDDRGCDVVAAQTETIRFLYENCQNWLLEYDSKRMQTIFS